MQKKDLITAIAESKKMHKIDVQQSVEGFIEEVKKSLAQGESVFLRGFGTFLPKKRKAKMGRNIKAGTAVQIPEHFIPAFRPSKEFKKEMKEQIKDTEQYKHPF